MSQELHYTSARRGLWSGNGYCTVACTANMPRSLSDCLENLSGYRPLFDPHDPKAPCNPVVFSHQRVRIGGASYHVLSRIGFAGLDYSDRGNHYAHHVVIDPREFPRGGPAWLLSRRILRESWDGETRTLASGPAIPWGDGPSPPCLHWQRASGDAGWAGTLAEAFLADPGHKVYLIHEPTLDLLPLVAEAEALLPPERRWDLTFSTYHTSLPSQGVECLWRGVLGGSREAARARGEAQALVIDLTAPLGTADGGPLVESARTGRTRPRAPHRPERSTGGASYPILEPEPGPASVPPLQGGEDSHPPPLQPDPPPSPTPSGSRAFVVASVVLGLLIGGLGFAGGMLYLRPTHGEIQSPDVAISDITVAPHDEVTASAQPPGSKDARPAPEQGSRAALSAGSRARPEVTKGETAPTTAPAPPPPGAPAADAIAKADAGAPPRTPDPRPPSKSTRFRDVRGVLPLYLDRPKTCKLDAAPRADVDAIRLDGLTSDDSEFRELGLSAEQIDRQLVISAKNGDAAAEGTEIAYVKIVDHSVRLEWLQHSVATFPEDRRLKLARAIRSCILTIEARTGDGSGTRHRIALREPIRVNSTLLVDQIGTRDVQEIKPDDQQWPIGRRLRILRCRVSDPDFKVVGVVPERKEGGDQAFFQVEDIDGASIKLGITQPEDGDGRVVISHSIEPSTRDIREAAMKKLDAIESTLDVYFHEHTKNRKTGEFSQQIKFLKGQFEPTPKRLLPADSWDTTTALLDGFTEDAATKKRIEDDLKTVREEYGKLKAVRKLQRIVSENRWSRARFHVIIGIDVDGEPIEVVRVGEWSEPE